MSGDAQDEQLRRLSLLVVDDDPMEAKLIAITLKRALCDVELVTENDPTAALRVCEAYRFDCVIIDYNMPELDGIELGAMLSQAFPNLPMVLMTSQGDEMLVTEALRRGFVDYIPKARFNRESAERLVRRAIQTAEQARIIEEQRQELEHFAYALAHDFKQPIRQIRMFADMVQDEVDAPEGSDLRRRLTYLGDASRRLSALVDVMSQYTLLNKAPELAMVDLASVSATVSANLDVFIQERGAFVSGDCAGEVYGNEALLVQVLQNLVMNGLRYNEAPIPVVLVAVETTAEGKTRISVKDNGIGIEPQYLTEIFKPLMRLHGVSKYPGSGLGLTIARKAALAQQGTIWCVSTPGAGSEFVVELLARAPEGAIAAVAA
ncbi:MAG: ATP-binding protein [Pseudomonadota bacterium]